MKHIKITPFWRNVFTVMFGTSLSQVIPMLAVVLLARILSKDALGSYFTWMAISSIVMVTINAGLDKSIFVAHEDRYVNELLQFAFVIGLVVCFTVFTVASLFNFFAPANADNLIFGFVASVVIYSLAMAFNRTLQAVSIYRSKFDLLNKSKIFFAVSISLSQILATLLGWKINGLVYSAVLWSIVSVLFTAKLLSISIGDLANISISSFKKTFVENYHFITFSFPSELISSLSSQFPVIITATRFGSLSVAVYSLTLRSLAVPIGLLGNSVLTVFKDNAGKDFREKGECKYVYLRTLKSLIVISFFPFLLLHFFGSNIFELVFGHDWIIAGQYAETLSILYFFVFISSPLSYVLFFSKKGQFIDLTFQVVGIIISYLVFTYSPSMENAIFFYTVFGSFYYVIYLFASFYIASGSNFLAPLGK